MNSSYLVLASTGTVGSEVVNALVEAGAHVRAGARNIENQPERAGVEYIQFDFANPDTFEAALQGTKGVFLLSPVEHGAVELLSPFLNAAAEGGERKIVFMSAIGVDSDDSLPLRQVELLIQDLGAPYAILRPNWFMNNFQNHWSFQVQAGQIALPAEDAKTAFIDARDIGASAAAALLNDEFNGQAWTLNGPESLSYADAAEVLAQNLGREISYTSVTPEQFISTLEQLGVPQATAKFLAGLFEPVRAGYVAQTNDHVKTLTGREPYTLEQYVRDHTEKLNGKERQA